MYYNNFQDLNLSALGMGTMRLPVIDGNDADINVEQTKEMVDAAFSAGINYYDTAWGYHDGNSECVVKEALVDRYPRDAYYLADKFPGYDLGNMGKCEEIFEEQLKKCGVDYFDFYLIHNVCELNIDAYLDPRFGTYDYFVKQKENGRVRHLGFSAHGGIEVLRRFLEVYGDHMEFCQLQINYMDWEFQEARQKVELLAERGIPVWIMEPVRGGMLCSFSEEEAKKMAAFDPDETPTGWALRFLQTIPEAVVALTGASTLEQMAQNIETFDSKKGLSDQEYEALMEIAAERVKVKSVPCTACRYCTSHCPQELDIPWLLSLYNEHMVTGGGFIAPMALGSLKRDKRPQACVGCRSCEQVCPQQIKISEELAAFTELLNQ